VSFAESLALMTTPNVIRETTATTAMEITSSVSVTPRQREEFALTSTTPGRRGWCSKGD
jgi:hypothetical protein